MGHPARMKPWTLVTPYLPMPRRFVTFTSQVLVGKSEEALVQLFLHFSDLFNLFFLVARKIKSLMQRQRSFCALL